MFFESYYDFFITYPHFCFINVKVKEVSFLINNRKKYSRKEKSNEKEK